MTDRLDVAVAVPFVWLDLEGTRTDTYRGSSFLQAQATASSSGFGDVAVRAKYHFFDRGGARLAAAGEIVLPTGREEDLLGAGRSATRVMAMASLEREYVGLHANIGIGLRRGLRRDNLCRRDSPSRPRRASRSPRSSSGGTLATSDESARSPRRTR